MKHITEKSLKTKLVVIDNKFRREEYSPPDKRYHPGAFKHHHDIPWIKIGTNDITHEPYAKFDWRPARNTLEHNMITLAPDVNLEDCDVDSLCDHLWYTYKDRDDQLDSIIIDGYIWRDVIQPEGTTGLAKLASVLNDI